MPLITSGIWRYCGGTTSTTFKTNWRNCKTLRESWTRTPPGNHYPLCSPKPHLRNNRRTITPFYDFYVPFYSKMFFLEPAHHHYTRTSWCEIILLIHVCRWTNRLPDHKVENKLDELIHPISLRVHCWNFLWKSFTDITQHPRLKKKVSQYLPSWK